MKKHLVLIGVILFISVSTTFSYGPQNSQFGFGIQIGEPTAITAKYWLSRQNSMQFSVGSSFFGSTRIGFDYLWNIDAFRSPIFGLYAGPGAVLAFGRGHEVFYEQRRGRWYYRSRDDGMAVGARGLFGVNAIPRNTPIEFYMEIGVLVGVIPRFGSVAEGAVGVRFYF